VILINARDLFELLTRPIVGHWPRLKRIQDIQERGRQYGSVALGLLFHCYPQNLSRYVGWQLMLPVGFTKYCIGQHQARHYIGTTLD
jgi:hypothetical protein